VFQTLHGLSDNEPVDRISIHTYTAGHVGGRHYMAGQYGYVPLGQYLV